MAENQKLLSRNDASEYLKATWGLSRSKATLAKLAVTGEGPSYHRPGRDALYAPAALDAYARQTIGTATPLATQHKTEAADAATRRGVAA